MNSCRYPEVAKNSALFQKLVAGEWINRHQNLLIIGPTESDSCPNPTNTCCNARLHFQPGGCGLHPLLTGQAA
jgi:hypothetical protein